MRPAEYRLHAVCRIGAGPGKGARSGPVVRMVSVLPTAEGRAAGRFDRHPIAGYILSRELRGGDTTTVAAPRTSVTGTIARRLPRETAHWTEMAASMDTKDAARSTGHAGSAQFVGFALGGQLYAFRIERIQEIVIPSGVTRIPEVPRYVEGVSNLRGTIIPIVSFRILFGLEPRPVDADTRTIVVNVGTRTIGCSVDSVSRVMRIAPDQIQAAPETVVAAGRRYIDGFARVGEDLFILLDVDQLLDPANLDEVHRLGLVAATEPGPSAE